MHRVYMSRLGEDQIGKAVLVGEESPRGGADLSPSLETLRTARAVLCVERRTIGREIVLTESNTKVLVLQILLLSEKHL